MNIYLNDISKSFGKKKVILPLSLTFESGKFTTLLGSSGCGKTTLLRMIAGLEIPDTGEIKFDDTIVFSKDRGINLPPEKRNLSFVFQDFALWPHMTVFENVAFGLKARQEQRKSERESSGCSRHCQTRRFKREISARIVGRTNSREFRLPELSR